MEETCSKTGFKVGKRLVYGDVARIAKLRQCGGIFVDQQQGEGREVGGLSIGKVSFARRAESNKIRGRPAVLVGHKTLM